MCGARNILIVMSCVVQICVVLDVVKFLVAIFTVCFLLSMW